MNKPNILSNKFDQAKKTGKWYQKELKDEELLAAINDAFLHASDEWADVKETNFADQTFFVRTIDKGVSEWFVENKE